MAQTKANDLSAIGIRYQAQISKVLFNTYIGNVAYPKLIRALNYQSVHQVLVLPEPVRGKSGSRATTLSTDQQSGRSKQLKESITTYRRLH
jgi:hypothetical protein